MPAPFPAALGSLLIRATTMPGISVAPLGDGPARLRAGQA
jgi:hypothetical protein